MINNKNGAQLPKFLDWPNLFLLYTGGGYLQIRLVTQILYYLFDLILLVPVNHLSFDSSTD